VQGFLFGKPGPRSGIEAIVNGEANAVSEETVLAPAPKSAAA
jgi:hypothetical protein